MIVATDTPTFTQTPTPSQTQTPTPTSTSTATPTHTRDFDVGAGLLLDWVIATASLGAIGCLLAGGHPLSVIAAAISSPFTPIHPLLSSGMVSATVELAVRRPQVSDFGSLRDDVTSVRGWWRNRVSRVLLNFLLTNFGTALGVYLTGWRILDSLL